MALMAVVALAPPTETTGAIQAGTLIEAQSGTFSALTFDLRSGDPRPWLF